MDGEAPQEDPARAPRIAEDSTGCRTGPKHLRPGSGTGQEPQVELTSQTTASLNSPPLLTSRQSSCPTVSTDTSVRLSVRTTTSPIGRMGTSVRMAGGSLAERHDAHQRRRASARVSGTVGVSDDPRAARARHPDAIGLDGGVQLPAVFVLEDEGFEGVAQVNGRHRHLVYSMPRPQPLDTGSPVARPAQPLTNTGTSSLRDKRFSSAATASAPCA